LKIFGTKKGVLAEASKVLAARGKLLSAIQAEVDKLGDLLKRRVAAERQLTVAETAAALGEQSDVTATQQNVDEILAAIAKQGARLVGLRSALAKQAGELTAARDGIAAALPEHVEAIRSEFEKEWAAGVAVFSALQGRRQALETRVGRLNLAGPTSTAATLQEEVEGPFTTKAAIETAISDVAGMDTFVRSAPDPNAAPFDAAAVYRVVSPYSGFAVGSLVMEYSGNPGHIKHLAGIGYVARINDAELSESLNDARQANLRFAAEQRDTEAKAQHARDGAVPLLSASPEVRSSRQIPALDPPTRISRPIQYQRH
jgi:hypothetical protein